MPTHEWHFEVSPQARQQITDLPTSKQRMAIFAAIRQLLVSDNPTIVQGVRKLVGEHFKDQWRQRQGDYRIIFSLAHGKVIHAGHSYKGTVQIWSVIHRSKAY